MVSSYLDYRNAYPSSVTLEYPDPLCIAFNAFFSHFFLDIHSDY